ncbi:MAG TPA: TIGR02996 domain-containing protein [Archangium sp.]
MSAEETLLRELAERPDDRALRLVFSDWLLERGDERGEVIALHERGNLSLTERRRVARITTAKSKDWLGPLAPLADPHRTRFTGGFLEELVCAPGRPQALFDALTNDPRLGTVRSLVVPAAQVPVPLGGFLGAPALRRLERLELGSTDWFELKRAKFETLAPPQVVLGSWGVFTKELSPLVDVKLFMQGRALGLSTTEFVNPLVVDDVYGSLVSQHRALEHFESLTLMARYGVLEGAAAWLLAVDRQPAFTEAMFPALEAWGVESGEVSFVRRREGSGAFSHLTIDLSLPEAPGEKRATSLKPSAEVRIATAASVLVLLGPARLSAVDVKLPEGGRLRSHERHTLYAAARRSGTLERFTVLGEAVLP